MSNTVWKGFERFIGKAFGTTRNMGSGRINKNDFGEDRPGDVVTPAHWKALIECKTRKTFPKSGVWYRAISTQKEAKALGLENWFHFERKVGNKQVYILVTNKYWIEKIIGFIAKTLDNRKDSI